MTAKLIYRQRIDFDDGAILEAVIWKLPAPLENCAHPFKYRLYYGLGGQRVIGYDNHSPKGDHRHRGGREYPYRFTTPEALIADFIKEVEKERERP